MITNLDNEIIKEIKESERDLLLYSLSCLQHEALKKHNINPFETQLISEYLYEHHYISYPRTDSKYLHTDNFKYSAEIITNIQNYIKIKSIKKIINTNQKSLAFNDSLGMFNDAIHPIISHNKSKLVLLKPKEQLIFNLICIRYLIQFLPSKKEFLVGDKIKSF